MKALIELLDSKPLDNVTIQDICDRAEVHRTTFYKHYGSIFDVVNAMSDEITGKLLEVMEVLDSKEIWFDFLAKFITDYRNPLKNINKTKYKDMLISPLAVVLYEFYYKLFKMEKKEIPDGVKMEWLIRYHVSGTIAMVEHWLGTDCTQEECRKGIEGMYNMIFS
ncbi:MAG: TetR/AcrR family transcriptional regulator [Thermoflexaceae bacterium]|nr:TetR/AcrR family transcriptional regulator [Thermoflexaceae bacterium]